MNGAGGAAIVVAIIAEIVGCAGVQEGKRPRQSVIEIERAHASTNAIDAAVAIVTTPPAPWFEEIAHPECIIRGEHARLLTNGVSAAGFGGSLVLENQGIAFAAWNREVTSAEIRVHNDHATARLFSEGIELVGEIRIDKIQVRPRSDTPIDGWLLIDEAAVDEFTGDSATLEVPFPDGVEPAQASMLRDFSCSDLTLDVPMRNLAPGKLAVFRRGLAKAPLREAPLGKIVARISTPPSTAAQEQQEEISILETRANVVKVRIDYPGGIIEAWTDASYLLPQKKSAVTTGMVSLGRQQAMTACVCRHDVPILDADGPAWVRVGTVKSGSPFVVVTEAIPKIGMVPIQLGLLAKARVRAESLAGCSTSSP
jgi:hypothetical protein